MANDFGLRIGLEGEKEFKKAIAEINSSFKVLGSEMKLVSSQFDKNDSSVKSLTARNEVLNKEIEAQKQKIEVLRQALQNASESFGENDRRTQAWQIQLNNAEAALNDMEREVESNEKAIDEMGDEMSDTGKDSDKLGGSVKDTGKKAEDAKAKFEKFKSTLAAVGKACAAAIAAIGTAAVAAGKALWDMANKTAEYGDEIEKNSQKVGLSYESYQKWDYAMKVCGTEMSSCTNGLKTLTNTFDDAINGSASATEKFERLGLSMEDLQGLSREDLFATVVTALQGVEDETEKAALANDMFGKSGQELLPLFNLTEEELQGLMDECEAYGMVMSDDAVNASAAFEDSLTKLKGTLTGLKNAIAGEMLPALTMIMDGFSDLIAGNDEAADKIGKGMEGLIRSITDMIPKFTKLITTIAQAVLKCAPEIISALAKGILDAIPELMPVVMQVITDLVSAMLDLLPQIVEAGMQIIASLILGIAEALPTLIPQIVEIVVQIVQTIIDNLPLIMDAALQLVTGLAQGILDAIPVLIDALPELILSIINFILESIPQIIDAGIKLLTSLVEALPTIIQKIVQAIPKIIDGIIKAVINAIPQIIDAGIKLLVALIQALPEIITTIVQAIPEIVGGIVDAFIGNIDKIIMAGVDLFIALIENLPTIITEIVKAVPKIVEGIVNAFGSLVGKMVEAGANLLRGLWNGIKSMVSWLWDKVKDWAGGLVRGIKNLLGIHSPSKVFANIGENMGLGLGEGFVDAMSDVEKDMQDAIPTDFDLDPIRAAANIDATTALPSNATLAGSVAAMLQLMKTYLPQMGVRQIVTDTGAVIGWLAPEMDNALGQMQKWKVRYA